MKLVIGGYDQGKLEFALQRYKEEKWAVFDGRLPSEKQLQELCKQKKKVIIYHFHNWIRERILQEGNPEEEIIAFLGKNPESMIISDEVGNGIVPIDFFEREYRERTGRILVTLANQADEVVRVICGIGQKIK